MSDCERCAALQRQNDFLANDRDGYVQLLTDENNKLRAEVERLSAYAKKAAMDVLLCKDGNILLHEENEKLRAALREYVCNCPKNTCEYFPCGEFARVALEEK